MSFPAYLFKEIAHSCSRLPSEVHQNCNSRKCKVVRISMFVFLGAACFLPSAPQKPDGWKHGISNSLESVCQARKDWVETSRCLFIWRPQRERGHVLSHSNGASECLTRSWSAEQLCGGSKTCIEEVRISVSLICLNPSQISIVYLW